AHEVRPPLRLPSVHRPHGRGDDVMSERPARVSEGVRNPWVRLLAAIAAVVLLLRALEAVREVLAPFVIAFALAYFLNPVVTVLERTLARGGWLMQLHACGS